MMIMGSLKNEEKEEEEKGDEEKDPAGDGNDEDERDRQFRSVEALQTNSSLPSES